MEKFIFLVFLWIAKKKEVVIKEAQEIYGVKEVIPSIILVDELSRNKN